MFTLHKYFHNASLRMQLLSFYSKGSCNLIWPFIILPQPKQTGCMSHLCQICTAGSTGAKTQQHLTSTWRQHGSWCIGQSRQAERWGWWHARHNQGCQYHSCRVSSFLSLEISPFAVFNLAQFIQGWGRVVSNVLSVVFKYIQQTILLYTITYAVFYVFRSYNWVPCMYFLPYIELHKWC